MRIDMFVYNRCTTDARVLKEASTLSEAGHRVRIVAVLDETTTTAEERDGFRIVRIERNPVHYRLLRAIRSLTRLARLGAAETAGRLEESEGRARRRGPAALLLAPLAIVIRILKPLWQPLSAAIRLFEAATRRVLLAPHKPLMFFDYYKRAYALVRTDPPDALHAHDLNTLPVAAALAARLRLRLVYDAHELYPEISTLSRREAAIWRYVERRLARRATTIVTVCESIAEEIELRNKVARPTVLLNCPAASVPVPGDDRNLLRDHVGLPEGQPILLYQGGFAPHRGLSTTVLAAHHLERGTIVLMGWGRLEDELRELVRRERLGERVLITGPVPREQVVAYAAGADVGLIPYEPVGLNNTYSTPNKLFDYMAAGLPIAASRLPELVRFVDGGEIGLTFAPGDPVALATVVNELLGDTDRHARMREQAREMGRRYTWERESRKLVSLYGG